jgi:RNA-directed DNA polymerase
MGTRPSQKRIQRFCEAVSQMTERNTLNSETAELIRELNLKLKGWANYFCLGAVSKAYKAVDRHTGFRLRQWLRRKHKKKGAGTRAYSDEYLYEGLGLVRLEKLTKNLPWAKAAQT